jgi:penicillin amidase
MVAVGFGWFVAGCPGAEKVPGDGGDGEGSTEVDGGKTEGTLTEVALDGSEAEAVVGDPAARAQILGVTELSSRTLPGLEAPAYVVRTEMNVPHVYAASRHDLGLVLGFVVASDRFFFMDLQRRLGLGTLSEILGEGGLGRDMEARLQGMTYVADRLSAHLTPEDGAYLDAYAAGINHYIDRVAADELPAPSELRMDIVRAVLGYEHPSEIMADFDRRAICAMIAVVMFSTTFGGHDVGRSAKAQALDTVFAGAPLEELRYQGALGDLWQNVRPLFPYASAAGWGLDEDGVAVKPGALAAPKDGAAGPPPVWKPLDQGLLARASARAERFRQAFTKKDDAWFGSNAWAVAGQPATGGAAVVAGDGHLQLSVPSIMYQVGLDTQVFGGGDIAQAGILITSLPVLAVGTNGKIAWSQVNPVNDTTDYYREVVVLDASGSPTATVFQGQEEALQAAEEAHEVADIPALDSVGRTETWTRYSTFDGRVLMSLEGRKATPEEPLAPGESLVNLAGELIVPGDQDGDGQVTAVSFDYAGFDTTQYLHALEQFGHAEDVYQYREMTRALVGSMLFAAVGDSAGNILYSSYQAVPCRSQLPRDADGHFKPGADPTMLLDGTLYGGFELPSGPGGLVDESLGKTDPSRCLVPFDETPQSINPASGYLATANNQPAPITDDGDLYNEPWFIGGPWDEMRVDTIAHGEAAAIAAGDAGVEAMAKLQANTRSRLGELFTATLLDALATAKSLLADQGTLAEHQARLLALYKPRAAALDEVGTRLQAWHNGGFRTPSGVETFYHQVAPGETEDAVATMLFNAWLPRAISRSFDDEQMDAFFAYSGGHQRVRALHRFLGGRGAQNPEGLVSFNPDTGEAVFFDDRGTPEIERSYEILVGAMVQALDFLESAPAAPDRGGFGTPDMQAWRWGLRHQARFESLLAEFLGGDPAFGFLADAFSITTEVLPLADSLPEGDPRKGLKWFPRQGDNYSVDAAGPGFSGTDFTHWGGPVMRMVIALQGGKVWGQNIVPGGQSGHTDSPHFADQLKLWLANQTVPLRYHPADVATGATGRETFLP